MIALSGRGIRELDRRSIEEGKIPGAVLMEEAALGAYRYLRENFPLEAAPTLLLAGKGNNGGDVLALARIFRNRSLPFRLILALGEEGLSPLSALQRDILAAMGVPMETYRESMSLSPAGLVVDGIFGSGFQGRLAPPLTRLRDQVAGLGVPVVAMDIQSGWQGGWDAAGKAEAFPASHVLALGYPRPGQLLWEEGELTQAALEFPKNLLEEIPEEEKLHFLTLEEGKALLGRRAKDTHKGSFGRVAVLGGAKAMSGAPLLSAISALRSGSGLATAFIEEPGGLYGKEKEIILKAWDELPGSRADVLVLGPGLGQKAVPGLSSFLQSHTGPVVLDADGLLGMKEGRIPREAIPGPLVLTPHPGEAGMLLGETPVGGEARRACVLRLAREYGGVAVLKGHRTLISDGERIAVNLTGNPGMATAGSGDVLAGVIASLLGQGLEPFGAAVLGAFLHGLAGDLAAQAAGIRGLLAGDLSASLPRAFLKMEMAKAVNTDLYRIL